MKGELHFEEKEPMKATQNKVVKASILACLLVGGIGEGCASGQRQSCSIDVRPSE